MHCVSASRRFLQQDRIHQGPHDAVLTAATHALSVDQTQQVLRMLGPRQLLRRPRVQQVPNPHRELQREGLRQAPIRPKRCRLICYAWPSHHLLPGRASCHLPCLLVRIHAIWHRLHRTCLLAHPEVL